MASNSLANMRSAIGNQFSICDLGGPMVSILSRVSSLSFQKPVPQYNSPSIGIRQINPPTSGSAIKCAQASFLYSLANSAFCCSKRRSFSSATVSRLSWLDAAFSAVSSLFSTSFAFGFVFTLIFTSTFIFSSFSLLAAAAAAASLAIKEARNFLQSSNSNSLSTSSPLLLEDEDEKSGMIELPRSCSTLCVKKEFLNGTNLD
mmetsp:Transcript_32893/g.79575  ORF Transcript_32893/g.79575 Transcript_32893/m.79575 type:complete len:203 (-) Transcript_32893:128-736(-)